MEKMTLKEFVDGIVKDDSLYILKDNGVKLMEKLLELESIENWFIAMYGVEFFTQVYPRERKESSII